MCGIAWVVYLCGCTDCFPWAVFIDHEHALKWALDHVRNPEGYIIKEVDVSEVSKLLAEQD